MKKLIAVLFLFACHNDAIIFAEAVNPQAICSSIHNSWTGKDKDVATCKVGTEVWLCTANVNITPECRKIGDIPLEKK